MIQCHLCRGLYDDFTVHSQVCPRKASLSHSPISIRSPRDFDSTNGVDISSPDEVHDQMFQEVPIFTPCERQSQMELVMHLRSVSTRASKLKAELDEGRKSIALAERSKMQAEYDMLIDECWRLRASIKNHTLKVQEKAREICNEMRSELSHSPSQGGLETCDKEVETSSVDRRVREVELEMQSRLTEEYAELEMRSEIEAELERTVASQSQALEAELEMQSRLKVECIELEMRSDRIPEMEIKVASQSQELEAHIGSRANLESVLSEQRESLEVRAAMQRSLEERVAQQIELIDAQRTTEVQVQAGLADLEVQASRQEANQIEAFDAQHAIESQLRAKVSDLETRFAQQTAGVQAESSMQARMKEQIGEFEMQAASQLQSAEVSSQARIKNQIEEVELYAAKQMQVVESSMEARMKEQIEKLEFQAARQIQSAEFAESSAQARMREQMEELEMQVAKQMELEQKMVSQHQALDAQKAIEAGLVAERSKLIESHSMREAQLHSKLADLESRFIALEHLKVERDAQLANQNMHARSDLDELQRQRQWLHQENADLKRELARIESSEIVRDELITSLTATEQSMRRVEIAQSEDLSSSRYAQEEAIKDMMHYKKAEMQREGESQDLRKALQEECRISTTERHIESTSFVTQTHIQIESTSLVSQTHMHTEDRDSYQQGSQVFQQIHRCAYPGCSKPTSNGLPGYCSQIHRDCHNSDEDRDWVD